MAGRTYNAPTSHDVAAILPCIVDDATRGMYGCTFVRDIVLSKHDSSMQTIDDRHHLSDPLTFPLLFPMGEKGWRPNILRERWRHLHSACACLFHLILHVLMDVALLAGCRLEQGRRKRLLPWSGVPTICTRT